MMGNYQVRFGGRATVLLSFFFQESRALPYDEVNLNILKPHVSGMGLFRVCHLLGCQCSKEAHSFAFKAFEHTAWERSAKPYRF